MTDSMGIDYIKKCQQNRFPLLFIDRMLRVEPGVRAEAIKNFSYNEWYFPAHFDDEPIVPGFVLLESMTQTFLMTFLTLNDYQGEKTSFLSASNVQFRKKVAPGDTLTITSSLNSFRHGVARGQSVGQVEELEVCSCELTIGIPSVLSRLQPRA